MDYLIRACSVAMWAVIVLIPCCALVGAYRAYLHPLSSFRGPPEALVSDAYGGWFAAQRTLHRQTSLDHERYGPIVRQGPNKLVFNTATAVQDIYASGNFSKSHCYQVSNPSRSSSTVFTTIDKPLHQHKRRLISQVLTERSMRTFEPKMLEQVNIFLRQILLTSQKSHLTSIDMAQRCKWLALDIVGHLAFGYDLKLQTEQTNRYLPHAMATASRRMNVYMQFPLLRILQLELFFYAWAVIRGKSFLKTITKMMHARVGEAKHAKHDLYSFMADALDAPDADDRVMQQEIWVEAAFFLPAGGDTTSVVLSSVFYHLANSDTCRKKLSDEIEATFGSGEDIRIGPALSGCKYLRACIDEALRKSPPVPGILWREQSPPEKGSENGKGQDKPAVVDGHAIPRGTQVGVSAYCLHHNPEYFPDPFTYKPERWLEADGKEARRAAFIAFSAGARSCAGKSMAYHEASLTLARTMWYFDFKLIIGGRNKFYIKDVFTSIPNGPHLHFKPRGDRWKELVA